MKPTSTLDIILAVIKLVHLAIELIKKKEQKKDDSKAIIVPHVVRNDHANVLNDFLGRPKD